MKKLILKSILSLSIIAGLNIAKVEKANAGIIVIATTSTAAIIGPVIGIGMTSAGFFWGIQSDDLNYKAAALFILENKLDATNLEFILAKRYPELDSNLTSELSQLILEENDVQEFSNNNTKSFSIQAEKHKIYSKY